MSTLALESMPISPSELVEVDAPLEAVLGGLMIDSEVDPLGVLSDEDFDSLGWGMPPYKNDIPAFNSFAPEKTAAFQSYAPEN